MKQEENFELQTNLERFWLEECKQPCMPETDGMRLELLIRSMCYHVSRHNSQPFTLLLGVLLGIDPRESAPEWYDELRLMVKKIHQYLQTDSVRSVMMDPKDTGFQTKGIICLVEPHEPIRFDVSCLQLWLVKSFVFTVSQISA